ncbi:hypothetical protein [Candidatus Stoquefichus sp. SB1]|uniref:hypothetical protein n=1 Tax=Candidatus Stoquefichus sp. SB1 TaxID=1658109 RepID=UPI00067EF19E|nr:hypothetical protein [Candidatus Stoquefichus sp. SB1]
MYINTTTISLIEQSVYDSLNINKQELDDLLEECYNLLQNNHHVFMLDEQYDFFNEYVRNHINQEIDKVMFIHLSRRLDQDNNGYGLDYVLTHETSLSQYLKKYGLTFRYENHIKMYIDDKEVIIHNDYSGRNLKQRLGYTFKDYAFSGYAFCENIIDNDYYEIAVGGPEFFGYLYPYFDDDALIDQFINKSVFYQFIYLLSIDDIEFEGYEELDNQGKQYHMVTKTLQRLYFYKYEPDFVNEMSVIMKSKNDVSEKYLINKVVL